MRTIAHARLTERDRHLGHEAFDRRLRRAPLSLLTRIVDCYLVEADYHADLARVARERWHQILDEIDRRRRGEAAA